MTSGATGQLYGNKYTWQFIEGWQDHLDTPGSQQMIYASRFFAARPWHKLVPDDRHAVVTAGYGPFATTGSPNDNDYVTAARTPDGNLVVAYIPSVRAITVDMTKLSGRTAPAGSTRRRGRTPPSAAHRFPTRAAASSSLPARMRMGPATGFWS